MDVLITVGREIGFFFFYCSFQLRNSIVFFFGDFFFPLCLLCSIGWRNELCGMRYATLTGGGATAQAALTLHGIRHPVTNGGKRFFTVFFPHKRKIGYTVGY